MTESLLQIRGLHVVFDVEGKEAVAVEHLDVDVAEDEVVALVGESGSGKSGAR